VPSNFVAFETVPFAIVIALPDGLTLNPHGVGTPPEK